ncbi:MAG: hypothetical protein ACK5II_10985 [Paracoccus sp. (in: a-proteobacteria)]
MMKTILLTALGIFGLAACGNGDGRISDPRMRLVNNKAYDEYRVVRESGLTGKASIPHVVPKARPYITPTAADLAGTGSAGPAGNLSGQAAAGGKGGYYDPDTGKALPSNPVPVTRTSAPATTVARPTVETDALARYAQAQRQAPGTRTFARTDNPGAETARSCARYPNADAAQLMFLSSGGPEQDPMGMDADGDGYVCGWDPTRYRTDRL